MNDATEENAHQAKLYASLTGPFSVALEWIRIRKRVRRQHRVKQRTLRFDVWQFRQLCVVLFLRRFLRVNEGTVSTETDIKLWWAGKPVVGVDGELEIHDFAFELDRLEGIRVHRGCGRKETSCGRFVDDFKRCRSH